jgi:hypothetical protein
MDKNVEDIIKEIKGIDNNVTGIIVPMLKDTIEDYRKIVFNLIFVIVFLIVGIVGMGISSQIIISQQIDKYNDFLSQFEYEGDEYTQQTNDTSDINSGINVIN